MSHWQKIRDVARKLRTEVSDASGLDSNVSAGDFLTAATEHLSLITIPEHPDSANLRGAMAVLEDDCIYFNNGLPEWYQAYCVAHEIGHFVLHQHSSNCSADDISELADDGDSVQTAEKTVGYGAGEMREREANLFALELLVPSAVLRELYQPAQTDPTHLSRQLGMPVNFIHRQLAQALLLPVHEFVELKEKSISPALDTSQREAAETNSCPVLVDAGPGTGKTQTLTGRISYLLAKGVEPRSILALTFSNKAAEEMRERISNEHPDEARGIQIMTFHSFGLDILRTFWLEADLDVFSPMLDKIDALLYLEKNLTSLDLQHYMDLREPTENLSAILNAISRAKDELCSPEQYLDLGKAMLKVSGEDEEQRMTAEKILETARVYRFYQDYLESRKMLDFGDLIFRTVRLLQTNSEVRKQVVGRYRAILVDEFQDVNRACGVLLKELAGDGSGLWAVGDLRQSIYRWRGASPSNIRNFGYDFPDSQTISLENNYRSKREIVDTFGHFAQTMKAAGSGAFCKWESKRTFDDIPQKAAVSNVVADTINTEADYLAESIELLKEGGTAYKEMAVICRTHNQLTKFAEILSARGIPVFYLGELFERDEVRDLLSLLDLRCSTNGHSLIRVAEFADYKIPPEDVKWILRSCRTNEDGFRGCLSDPTVSQNLTKAGAEGWTKLREHLQKCSDTVSPWHFLGKYIFGISGFLKPLFEVDSVIVKAKRLAIYQFLRFVEDLEPRFAESGSHQTAELLNYVKKLAWFNEDRSFAQIPPSAESLDAVRLLTVHAAKGLEFSAVFLPYLGAGKIPSKRRSSKCPEPVGMHSGDSDFHDEEEECLFFVALSRARDHLHLSRALDYSTNQSKFLDVLSDVCSVRPLSEKPPVSDSDDLAQHRGEQRPLFYRSDLDQYQRCPRKFYYSRLCGTNESDDISVYQMFHACLFKTVHTLQSLVRQNGTKLTDEIAYDTLNEHWQETELESHPYAPIYRKKAEEIIGRISSTLVGNGGDTMTGTFEVALSNGVVRLKVDSIEHIEVGSQKKSLITKFKTGKQPKKITPDDGDAITVKAIRDAFPENDVVLERFYLADNSSVEVSITDRVIKNRLEKYEKSIKGIQNGNFPPEPAANDCAHCSHYFVCPSG